MTTSYDYVPYSEFFGYFHFPNASFSVAFFLPVGNAAVMSHKQVQQILSAQARLIANTNVPQWLSFASHHVIATSQRQAGNSGYVVVDSPKILLRCQEEHRKLVILLNHQMQQGEDS